MQWPRSSSLGRSELLNFCVTQWVSLRLNYLSGFIIFPFAVENTFSLVLPSQSQSDPRPSGLEQLLALVKRSDSVPVKSEGTRVLVNVVKSLWSNVSISGSPVTTGSSPIANGTIDAELEKQKKKSACVRLVLVPETAAALASLVRRSGRFPLLVNEGVVALSLLSTHRTGGKYNQGRINTSFTYTSVSGAEGVTGLRDAPNAAYRATIHIIFY
jgi:hypothetical protein